MHLQRSVNVSQHEQGLIGREHSYPVCGLVRLKQSIEATCGLVRLKQSIEATFDYSAGFCVCSITDSL